MDFDAAAVERLLTKAGKLLQRIGQEDLAKVPGCAKLASAIKAEAKFLRKVLKDPEAHLNPNHAAMSSNLDHLGGIVACVEALFSSGRGCCAILKRFRTEENDASIDVDVVTDGGATWIKVVARNAKGTFTAFRDCEETGFKTIVSTAELWLDCADANPCKFIPPQVAFHFVKGIVTDVVDALQETGVNVTGRIVETVEEQCEETEDNDSLIRASFAQLPPVASIPEFMKLNLDVTTLVAYVSGLTNNEPGCDSQGRRVKFKDAVLVQQSTWEETTRVKPFLDQLFEGKQLMCCETAYTDFKKIVTTLGGPGEKKRAEELFPRLTIVPDSPSQRVSNSLGGEEVGGKIRPRSIIVFGTGDQLQVPTVTANTGFLRAAGILDVSLVTITHQSRALSEAKELLVEDQS